MDIPKRLMSNIFAVKILPFVEISTIGDGLGSILSEFYRIFLHRSHTFRYCSRNSVNRKLIFNGNSGVSENTLKSRFFQTRLNQDISQTGYTTNRTRLKLLN